MTRDDLATVLAWAGYAVEDAQASDTADAAEGSLALGRVAEAFGFEVVGDVAVDLGREVRRGM